MSESILDQIARERRELADKTEVTLPIPGYTNLFCRYRLIDALVEGKQIRDRLASIRNEEERVAAGAIDTLVEACTGFYGREPGGELVPIDPDGSGPLVYEERLAEAFQFEAETARDVVWGLFGGRRAAIMEHFRLYAEWSADPSSVVTLGEA